MSSIKLMYLESNTEDISSASLDVLRKSEAPISDSSLITKSLIKDLDIILSGLKSPLASVQERITSTKDKSEPPRLYRRLIYLSQAAMPDRVRLS